MGLDTVGTLMINGEDVLAFDNMFHRHRLPVGHLLREGPNNITVKFHSKVLAAAANMKSCDTKESVICPSGARNPVQHGFDNQNYLRTEPCSFSWDWGPGFAPMGIWRDLYIDAYDIAVVRDVTVVTTPTTLSETAAFQRRQSHGYHDAAKKYSSNDTSAEAQIARAFAREDFKYDLNTWKASFTVFLDSGITDASRVLVNGAPSAGGPTEVVVTASVLGVSKSATVSVTPDEETSVTIELDNIKASAWWPNGFGDHTLYTAVISADANGQHLGAQNVTFGFRTTELAQTPLPGGRSFFFRINGVPIPVKGSNW